MICKHCGASIDNPQAKFCPRCGGKQDVADSHPAPKDAVQSVDPQSKVAAPQQPQKPQHGQQTWQPWNPQQAQQTQQGQQTWQPWNPQQAQKPQQAQQTWQPWNPQQPQQPQKPQQGQQTWQPWNPQQAQQPHQPQQAQKPQQPQQAQKPQQPQQGQQAWQPWNPQQPQQSQKPQQPQNSLYAADQKKKKKTWIVILIVAVALVLLVSAVLLVTFLIPWSRGVGQNTMQDYQVEEYEDEPEERPDEDEAWAEDSMEQIASETASVVFDMPACVGMDRRSAMEYFDDADCTLVMEYEHSNDYEEGLVIRQSVEEGTQLQPGQEVTLVISMGAMPCPYEYSQKVTVSAPYGSSYATLVLYEWADGDWQEQFRCSATVGKNGISSNYGEGKGYSPEGVFKLGVALSANSIANDTWPFWQVDSNTCVVDDTDSYLYNTIQNKNDLASGISYDSIGRKLTNGTNNVLIYIEHNGNGINSDGVVSGKGSVITLCGCSASIKPTAGCVDISTSDMNTLLSLLDHSQNPHIELVTQ